MSWYHCCPYVHLYTDSGDGGDRGSDGGVTLLAQLANMPSMSPLISSPVPSVGSVVPSITPGQPNMLTQQQAQTSLPPTIVIATNGLTQQTPEVTLFGYIVRKSCSLILFHPGC